MSAVPQVVLVRPSNPDHGTARDVQHLLVEFGVDYLSHGADLRLPDRLPPSLHGVRLVILEKGATEGWPEDDRARLEAFRQAGGLVEIQEFRNEGSLGASPEPTQWAWNWLERACAHAGVVFDNPSARRRFRARGWDELLPPLLRKLPDYNTPRWHRFCDSTGKHIWPAYEAAHEWTGDEHYLAILCEHVDAVTQANPRMPETGDEIGGYPSLVRLTQATGDRRRLEFAAVRMEHVRRTFRRVCGSVAHTPASELLWCETPAMFAPAAVAVGLATEDALLVEEGLHCIDRARELCFDPGLSLWVHGASERWKCPVVWSRGQGWALYGIEGAMVLLPADHPAQERLRRYACEILEGLRRTQDDEGLWHQVMDDPHSRTELSGSCMFVSAFSRLARHGRLAHPHLETVVRRAEAGIRGRLWREWLCSVCGGMGVRASKAFYLGRAFCAGWSSYAASAAIEFLLAFKASDPENRKAEREIA